MGAVQVHRLQQRMLAGWLDHPALRLGVDGSGTGRSELGQGAVNGDPRGGPPLGAELGGQLVGGEGAVVAERPKNAGGGRP